MNLWGHQTKAVERAKEVQNLALFYDAGTGKTAAMVHILREEYNRIRQIKNTLVFAPLTVCPQWAVEFARFSKVPQEQILVLVGSGKDRVSKLAKMHKPCVVVTNYESVQIDAFYEALLRWNPRIAVFDESHRLKNHNSKRAKKIYPLTVGCDRRFLLTGTAVLNSLLDLFGQYKALDPLIFGGSFYAFRSRYFYDRNAGRKFQFPDWQPFPHSAEMIGKTLSATSVQAKRDDCLDLPPLHTIRVPVPLGQEQGKAYQEMKKDFMTEVHGIISSSEFQMVKTLRMQQILSGFIQPDEQDEPIYFKENPRLDALLDLVDSIGTERVIIWTVFRPTYNQIGEALGKSGIRYAYLTGDQSQSEKQEAIASFRNGDTQILIANPAAASEGINLQEAKYAIYYSLGYNLLHYLQSQARNYRGGTEALHTSVTHYILFAERSLDEVIATALLNKQSVGESVLNWAKGFAP